MFNNFNLPYVFANSATDEEHINKAFDEFSQNSGLRYVEVIENFYILNLYFEYLDAYGNTEGKVFSCVLPLTDCLLTLPLYAQHINALVLKSNETILAEDANNLITDVSTEIVNVPYTPRKYLADLEDMNRFSNQYARDSFYKLRMLHQKYKQHYLS